MMKKFVFTLAAVWMVALAGCNTVRGMGEDIKKAGETIEDAANKKK